MKKIKRITSLILCFVLTAVMLSACGSNDGRIDFIYPFEGNIVSFDPQISSTADEFLIIENCFEGLVRIRDNGEVVPGVAESWDISSDGKTYTFKLKKGTKWRIKEDSSITELMGDDFNPDITAHDFVFALQRTADPVTDSPLFSYFSNIVNASEVHSGKASADRLGVSAADDYTLVIQLKSPDDSFLSTLTTAAAMPCNEDFFNATKGRYGLGLGYTMFNGQFYVSSVLESSYILKNNGMYTGDHPAKVTDITLNITDGDADIAKNLKNGYYDCAYITGSEYEQLNDSKISVTPYSNKMWGIVLNKNRQIFTNSDLRQAVCLSVSRPQTSEHPYFTSATGITPPSCSIGSDSADKAIGTTVYNQDTAKAVELWRKGLEEEKFTSAQLTMIVTEDMEEIAKQLVQGIQGSIGEISSYGKDGKISFSLKIEVLNKSDFVTAFSNGEYDLALYCFESGSSNAVTFLNSILDGGYIGELDGAQQAVKKAQNASSADLASACKKAEQEILGDYSLLPLFYESSYYACAKGVSGVDFHPGSGRVSFVNATRED
ncbi:MAG: peptide ABC transporter substrate-binding protein [Eubacterium sp.]